MIRYNVNVFYNNRKNYNSSTDFIIVVSDGASFVDAILVDSSMSIPDSGIGREVFGAISTISLEDDGVSNDLMNLVSNIFTKDFGNGAHVLEIAFHDIPIIENAKGLDVLSFTPSIISFSDSGVGRDTMAHKSVTNYNSRKSYNKKWDAGGASYNSYKHHIVMVEDSAKGYDLLSLTFENLSFSDKGGSMDMAHLGMIVLEFKDRTSSKDVVSTVSYFNASDTAKGYDLLSFLLELNALESLYVTSDGILHPLGVLVTNDSREELLPSTRDSTEEVTGRHGEIDFGTEFKARMMELHVATDEGYEPIEKRELQRLFAMYLNPTKGSKKLVFGDDIEKSYKVKYSGKIDIANHPRWFEFVLPFKMNDPFIYGTMERSLVGTGKLVNEGTFETGLIIEIKGPVTNPSLSINGETVSYAGAISSGSTLVIDTEKRTVKNGNANARANYNRAFPLLYPGETNVVANSNVTIKWRDKWI